MLRVTVEALFERNAQEIVAQAHGLGPENACIHELRLPGDKGLEIHLREDVALDIDAGRNFVKLQTVRGQRKNAALRNVEDGLLACCGKGSAEGDMLYRLDEFLRASLAANDQHPVCDIGHQLAGRE